jgi:outer membrane protein TolC
LLVAGFFSAIHVNAQSTWPEVLEQIKSNNLQIKSVSLLHQSNSLKFKTGLTPPGISAEYEYIADQSPAALYQSDLLIKQSFAFPTTYIRKKQLSDEMIVHSEQYSVAQTREIIHQARLTYTRIVYYMKLKKHLEEVRKNHDGVLSSLVKRLESGDGNILDVNKARLQLMEINQQVSVNDQLLRQEIIHLKALNGGKDISTSGFDYEQAEILPEFEKLESEIEAADPNLKMLKQEQTIVQKQIRVERNESLPHLALGYRYQSVPGNEFNGFHTGITIPLWENKNRIRHKKAELAQSDQELQVHLNEHYYSISQLHDKYKSLRERISEIQGALAEIQSPALLLKALEAGHITVTEYYSDLHLFMQARARLLESEREYQEVIAELTKHKL